jgi:integrase
MKARAKRAFGSIYSKSEDRHQLRWSERGVRRTETVRGTLADAEARLDEIEREAAARAGRTMTVDEFWRTMYWPDASASLAPSTLRAYRDVYASAVRPAFGDVPMDSLRGLDVQRWLLSMPYGTARHARAVLSAVYSRAVAWDVVSDNPLARRYRLPGRETAVKPQSAAVMDTDALAAVADACHGEPWEAAFILSAFGGARRGEAFGVQTQDVGRMIVDGSTVACVEIRRGVQLIDGVVEVTKPKTEGSRRTVVVPEPWSLRLLALTRDALESGRIWLSGGSDGQPPNPNTMAAAYKRWFAARPFAYIPWKNLRNSYATNVHSAGVELPTVAKLLGHSRQQTTYVHYDRPTAEQLGSVVAKLPIGANHTGQDGTF